AAPRGVHAQFPTTPRLGSAWLAPSLRLGTRRMPTVRGKRWWRNSAWGAIQLPAYGHHRGYGFSLGSDSRLSWRGKDLRKWLQLVDFWMARWLLFLNNARRGFIDYNMLM
ncbi:unnamed protein product, partial [Effrenium voratum]